MAVELTVERLDGRGLGLARTPDGAEVLVAGALPGERVDAEPGEVWRVTAVREPSPHRVAPPCPHAEACGGCALQHADPAWLARWKRERIEAALTRRGLDTEIELTATSPPESRRRATLAATRRKSGVTLGFHRARDARIVDIERCLLVRPEIAAALPALRDLARLAASRSSEVRIAATVSEDGLDLALEGAKPPDLTLREAAVAWMEAADPARLTWNGEPLAERRPPRQRFGRSLAAPPPGAFLQATKEGEAALVERALAAVEGARRAADLFAGAGTFALPLAERMEVLAVEGDAAMVAALDRAWRNGEGLRRLVAVTRDLFRRPLSAEELKGVDAVVLDPPRAGAEAQSRALAGSGAAVIVGVSCNPASFARDAAILAEGGWRLERVTPVDQFLWSGHVELIGVFRR